jgi:hypothetical protein
MIENRKFRPSGCEIRLSLCKIPSNEWINRLRELFIRLRVNQHHYQEIGRGKSGKRRTMEMYSIAVHKSSDSPILDNAVLPLAKKIPVTNKIGFKGEHRLYACGISGKQDIEEIHELCPGNKKQNKPRRVLRGCLNLP